MNHLLLIHGAWGGAWEFQDTIDGLARRGHAATAIDLPGHGQRPVPISAVSMDAYARRVIEAVDAIDGPVVLVGHSLGGAVIAEVAERIPTKIERLVFVAAILPRNGESALGLMQSDEAGALLPRVTFAEDQSYATLDTELVKDVLLHDVQETDRLARMLPHFAMKQATEPFVFAARVTPEAFGSVPKSYVRASQDRVMSPALQDRMISSWDVDQVLTLDAGHFPLMSIPEQLVEALAATVAPPAGSCNSPRSGRP